MKSGLSYADRLTTVSPSYAEEIGSPALGFGLDGCIRARRSALVGIVNGADYAVWNPETDPLIAAQYSAEDLSGKAVCKRAVLGEYGLSDAPDRPLLGMVARLVDQKGIDLVAGALDAPAGVGLPAGHPGLGRVALRDTADRAGPRASRTDRAADRF